MSIYCDDPCVKKYEISSSEYYSMSLLRYECIDHSKISYSVPEKQGQVYYSNISYNDSPLLLVTPRLSTSEEGSDIVKKSTTNLVAEMVENDFKFYDCMLKLDERNIKETCSRSKEWFQKEIPLELIDDMYKRSNKPIQKGQKPSFQFKVPFLKEEPRCKIFDHTKVLVPIEKMVKGSEIECVIHVKGLKFLKQHYYCDCYISQIKVRLQKSVAYHIPDECLLSDSEDDVEDDLLDPEILETIQETERNQKQKQQTQEKEEKKRVLQEKIDLLQKEIQELTDERDKL